LLETHEAKNNIMIRGKIAVKRCDFFITSFFM
jgi:hypothetical protein